MRPRQILPAIIVPDEESQRVTDDRAVIATFANVDFQRIRFWCLSASVAADHPRRLGADASPQELTADKRVSRKACATYRTMWHLMHLSHGVPPEPEWKNWPFVTIDPLMTRIGATVIWERQIDYLIGVVERRMLLLTDLEDIALYDGMKSWYYKYCETLDWEYEALHRLQDYIKTKRPTL